MNTQYISCDYIFFNYDRNMYIKNEIKPEELKFTIIVVFTTMYLKPVFRIIRFDCFIIIYKYFINR